MSHNSRGLTPGSVSMTCVMRSVPTNACCAPSKGRFEYTARDKAADGHNGREKVSAMGQACFIRPAMGRRFACGCAARASSHD
jgi:hypothetical protein